MAAWLARIQAVGWTRHLSQPRYALVLLRALTVRGRAQRRRDLQVNVSFLNFLFPDDESPQQANKQAKRGLPRLPNDLFRLVARYYWGGGLWAEEETALAAEVAARRERDAAGEGDDAQGY
mmetsp:Transcript_21814/g.65371  ORF Transcript_21814/g.65371 Transcript_21814/m.65371 type:complete len:121 (+) Transcript_21814:874-1236(+)